MKFRYVSLSLLVFAASCGGSQEASNPPVLVVSSGKAALAATDAMTAESKIAYPWASNFVTDSPLPELDSDARSYKISPGSFTSKDVASLGSLLGVDGDVYKAPDSMGGGYTLGSQNGTGSSLWVSGDATGFWSFSESSAATASSCVSPELPVSDGPAPETSASDSSNSVSVAPCLASEYPKNVPSEKESRRLFEGFLADLGLSADDFVIEYYSDAWATSVYGFLKIDGVRTPLSVSASYGDNGTMMWASGFLGKVEPASIYPRIGTKAGLERLNNNYASPEPALKGVPESTIGSVSSPVDAGAAVDPAAPSSSVSSDQPSVTSADQAPVPGVQDTLIVSVEQELVMLYLADGSMYLVPGYAFLSERDQNGYQPRYVVSALPEEFVKHVVSPSPVPETLPQGSSSGSSGQTAPDQIVSDQIVSDKMVSALVGLSESEAAATAKDKGWELRVVSRDGEDFMVTQDYKTDRVNITVKSGKVTKASVG